MERLAKDRLVSCFHQGGIIQHQAGGQAHGEQRVAVVGAGGERRVSAGLGILHGLEEPRPEGGIGADFLFVADAVVVDEEFGLENAEPV